MNNLYYKIPFLVLVFSLNFSYGQVKKIFTKKVNTWYSTVTPPKLGQVVIKQFQI
jgi:hypothetical protein